MIRMVLPCPVVIDSKHTEGSAAGRRRPSSLVQVFVLGVDPGVSRCGYAVLETRGTRSVVRALGVLRTPPTDPLPRRLADLAADVTALFDEFDPAAVAIERVLFGVNVRSAMSVGQASGLVMAESGRRGRPVTEYSPNQVKDAVTGNARAPKEQVMRMIQTLLGLSKPPRPADAADAAAVALCHVARASLDLAPVAPTGGRRR